MCRRRIGAFAGGRWRRRWNWGLRRRGEGGKRQKALPVDGKSLLLYETRIESQTFGCPILHGSQDTILWAMVRSPDDIVSIYMPAGTRASISKAAVFTPTERLPPITLFQTHAPLTLYIAKPTSPVFAGRV